MSFSSDVKKELLSLPNKMNCCKKAFMLGLVYDLETCGDSLRAVLSTKESADEMVLLLGDNALCSVTEITRGGRKRFMLEFSSKSVLSFISKLKYGQTISEAAKFRCDDCRRAFLRGVLISSATVNDPSKSYHLEIALRKENDTRLLKLGEFLTECGFSAKIIERQNAKSLYFKSNAVISDVLNYAGAMKAGFALTNTYIEKDFRNDENRATNCVARNISRSVASSQKHLLSINKLITAHKIDVLPEELRETAYLRIENEELSLSELALLHEPPISKSGLNHRLEKICKAAEELDS